LLHYLVRRLLAAVPVLLIVSMLAFAGMELVPGGPIYAYLGSNPEGLNLTGEQIKQLEHDLGLDQPLPVRYVRWLGHAVRGARGASIRT
jgi:peptide/nickel transport system permease protein